MACRGVFFALTREQKDHLLELGTDDQRREYVQEVIEAAWDQDHLLETDKAWEAIHRCLTDGTLIVGRATAPLGKLILGGKQLHSDTQSYIINLIEEQELPQIIQALKAVSKDWMKSQYGRLRSTDYPHEFISDDDWQYTWEYFSAIPEFIERAGTEGRSVIFTVDQ